VACGDALARVMWALYAEGNETASLDYALSQWAHTEVLGVIGHLLLSSKGLCNLYTQLMVCNSRLCFSCHESLHFLPFPMVGN
jgi:hypothetical protein